MYGVCTFPPHKYSVICRICNDFFSAFFKCKSWSENMQLCPFCCCPNSWNLQGWMCCAFGDGRRTCIGTAGYLSDCSLPVVSNQSANFDLWPMMSRRRFPPQEQFVKCSFQPVFHQLRFHVQNHSIPPFIVILMPIYNISKSSLPHLNVQMHWGWLICSTSQVFFLI